MFPLGFLLAHVGRLVEIGKVLRARGHEVVFAGDWPRHERSRLGTAHEEGFKVIPMIEPDHPYAWDRFIRYGWMLTAIDLIRLPRWAHVGEMLEDQVRVIEEEKPDMLVCDATTTTSAASHITGVPAAGVLNAYGVRLISPGNILYPIMRVWDRLYLERFRRPVYKKFGVAPRSAMAMLKEMPMLSPDMEGMYDDPKGWPNYHTVGPIVSEPPCELPPWYGQLDDGKTNIYITMGSTGCLDTFLLQCYETLGKTPYRFVVTTAGQVTPETEAAAPSNFLFSTYAPGSQILEKCSAMIYHGGNGSMYQALAAGVPMIAVPSHLEQEICADLAIRHGFGLTVSVRKARGPRVAAMLEEILTNSRYATAAQGFADTVREACGASASADLLEKWARQS
jgi:UDP:flavonoid glycosyltransferase YjiC (YdhE family)